SELLIVDKRHAPPPLTLTWPRMVQCSSRPDDRRRWLSECALSERGRLSGISGWRSVGYESSIVGITEPHRAQHSTSPLSSGSQSRSKYRYCRRSTTSALTLYAREVAG